ncbi:hypothetical protein Tco_0907143 [Tanacetum coccineum]|uniref:Retroviral polymerase SH3-like domain-containing protein n=1 Tax=Tanacetum coccineum TaxID=301880 RepID=A0ABQ5CKP9_9ASTR
MNYGMGKLPNLSYLKVCGCEALVKRDTPDKLQQRSVKCIFIGYPKKMMGYYFYFPSENKMVVARFAEFLEKNLLSQEISGRAEELEEIQDEDTSPSENTSEIPMEVEGFEPPQEEVVPVRRNTKDMFLVYGENSEAELRVDCYCNAGFETNRDDIKSQDSLCFEQRRSGLEKLQAQYYCNVSCIS